MKKIFKVSVAALAALMLTTVLVSATVAATADKKVEFSCSSMPGLNCSMALSQVEAIFGLLPQEIKTVCRSEYAAISGKCRDSASFAHEGVKVSSSGHDGLVDLELSSYGCTLRVYNATWAELNAIFSE